LARYTAPDCRICRREGLKIFLKGDRCYSDKCAFERRGYPPGQHGQGRKKVSEYGIQLREKQKVKRMYGLVEKQFENLFHAAEQQKGITGWNLLLLLERRLDNMAYRAGFASSRAQARQLVRHGHISVNGKKVSVPSFLVKAGDAIGISGGSREIKQVLESLEAVQRRGVPGWIEVARERMEAVVKGYPSREELTMPIQEQLIVELYSK
jgi:small subunit ribosomal protein S4